MENLQSPNDVAGQSYFEGWFIALRNYEVYEIEAVKNKIAILAYEDENLNLHRERYSSSNNSE